MHTMWSSHRHIEIYLSHCYGVTGQSCLSALKSIDVTQCLPPDVRPDLFESVVPFVIKHLITNNVFNVDELNAGFCSFLFQGTKKTRLPHLSRQVLFGIFVIFLTLLVTTFLGTMKPTVMS